MGRRAGVSAADTLGGGLAGALDLAAAGTIEVADAAGIASTAMSQFGLSGKDIENQLTAADEAQENEMFDNILARIKDASRPFGGIQPFVSMAGIHPVS